jgi:hypothetical protein
MLPAAQYHSKLERSDDLLQTQSNQSSHEKLEITTSHIRGMVIKVRQCLSVNVITIVVA